MAKVEIDGQVFVDRPDVSAEIMRWGGGQVLRISPHSQKANYFLFCDKGGERTKMFLAYNFYFGKKVKIKITGGSLLPKLKAGEFTPSDIYRRRIQGAIDAVKNWSPQ